MRFLADGLRGPTRDGMDFTARNLQKADKQCFLKGYCSTSRNLYNSDTVFYVIFAAGFYFFFLNAMHFVSTKLYRFVKIGANNSETVAFRNFLGGFPLKTGKTAHPGYSWLCWLFKWLSRDCWDDIEAPHTGQRHLCPLPSWAVATCWSILS